MKSALIEKVAPKVGSDTYENNDRVFFVFFLLCSYYTSDPEIVNLCVWFQFILMKPYTLTIIVVPILEV